MSPEDLVWLLEGAHLKSSTEEAFQRSTEEALKGAGVQYEREYRLSDKDRVDFLVDGTIAIELKIHGYTHEVMRQLSRYAQHESITAVILLTSRTQLCNVPQQLHKKPILVALVQKGFL